MPYLTLKDIRKVYTGGVEAVKGFSMEAEKGEFVVLVGPSGCGKSTVLRMIAGLEGITSGDMTLDGKRINDASPQDRNIAMVFQDYALYGNMTVYSNIGFSLTVRGVKPAKIHEKVMGVSKKVSLFEYLNRFPKALSGGQKQRVAMGRSIAKEAKVLLMDEPLSNLDAKLRAETRKELSQLHHTTGATIVYVTHDQTEAMTLASKIVVINEGRIQQTGSPLDIYTRPANMFTAGFIGMPPINFIKGYVDAGAFTGLGTDGKPILNFALPADLGVTSGSRRDNITLGVRPEILHTGKRGGECAFRAKVTNLELLGAEYNAFLDLGGTSLTCRVSADESITRESEIEAAFDPQKAHFFDEAGERLRREGEA